jgi:hypothetical protein
MKFLNTLNRVVIVVLCLVLILVLTSVLILPQIILTGLGDWMAGWGDYLASLAPWLRLIVGALLAVVVDLILAAIIFFEVRPARQRYINVQQVAGGMANVSIESVDQLINYKLDPLPGVIKVTPRIRAKGSKVEAVVEVEVTRETNVPSIANRMIKIIQAALTEELGLQIAGQPEVRVNVTTQQSSPAPQGHQAPKAKTSEPAQEAKAQTPRESPSALSWTSSGADKAKDAEGSAPGGDATS